MRPSIENALSDLTHSLEKLKQRCSESDQEALNTLTAQPPGSDLPTTAPPFDLLMTTQGIGKDNRYPAFLILTALRGPDITPDTPNFGEIKQHITGRLRSIVYPRTYPYPNGLAAYTFIHGDALSRPMNQRDFDNLGYVFQEVTEAHKKVCTADDGAVINLEGDERRIWTGLSHFFSHLLSAVQATREHDIWGGFADKVVVELRGCLREF